MPIPKKPRPETGLSRREQAVEDRRFESQRKYAHVSEEARTRAEKLYKSGKFLCSEAVFTVVNDHLGQPADPRMVQMASGFPVGIGMSGCLCGAVAGGVMALGLKYGREEAGQAMSDDMFPMSAELHDRFQKRNCSTCCRKLIKNLEFGSRDHIRQCIRLTGEVAADVVDLIENGVEGHHAVASNECDGCPPEQEPEKGGKIAAMKGVIGQSLKQKMAGLSALVNGS